jgi:hypothetical protein
VESKHLNFILSGRAGLDKHIHMAALAVPASLSRTIMKTSNNRPILSHYRPGVIACSLLELARLADFRSAKGLSFPRFRFMRKSSHAFLQMDAPSSIEAAV